MSEAEDLSNDTGTHKSTSGKPINHDASSDSVQTRIESTTKENFQKTEQADTDADDKNKKVIDADGDSEAETLIESPEKKKTAINNTAIVPATNGENGRQAPSPNAISPYNGELQSRKRKRSVDDGRDREASSNPSHRSSPLSSPLAFNASADSDSDQPGKQKISKSGNAKPRNNGARDRSRESETKLGVHGIRQRRPSDINPHKRDKHNSDLAERRETRSATYSRYSDDDRSPSPQPIPRRDHRRGVSTQLTANEFVVKKRGRPPLINTRRNRSAERAASVSSDDSNSPAPPRSALSKLAGQDHDTMSPAKTGPRKWRDKNGRTFLARACNNNDLETAKLRLAERPEDLNWADNAGNTPLQIAALEGFVKIVRFLLEANCEVDTRNIDRETPLIDAVENGHVEVVKLLLDHGANPRLGNAKGDEPYELVPQDDENYDEIRALLADAKEREGKKHKAHEQVEASNREGGSSRAASAASPRDSPPIGPRSPPAFASRRRTGRSESTRNDLLWQANTQENLTKLAGKGDVQGVASILNILQKADTESLIAAAKAGHEEILQYLLGMGDPDPDPDPVRSLKPGYNTPMLAAIGRGHPDVVKLLANQSGFNPTRRYKDKTYFDLARERKGEDWQQEFDILKAAYENYAKSKGRKTSSPHKTRNMEKSKPRVARRSSSPASQKRMSSSPAMTHKSLPSTKSSESSPRDKRKTTESERRKTSGSKVEVGENSVAVISDLDQTVAVSKKEHRVRRSQSDLPLSNIESETIHKRRRLVTGKEHRRNRSNAPGSGSSSDETSREVIVVKQEGQPNPNLKRARSRSSMSPELKPTDATEKSRLGMKKRRTVLESSPDEARNTPKALNLQMKPQSVQSPEAPTQSIEVPKQEEEGSVADAPMADTSEANTDSKDADRPADSVIPDEEKSELQTEPQPEQGEQESDLITKDTLSEEVENIQAAKDKEEADRAARAQAEREAQAELERLAELEAQKAAAAAAAAAAEAEAEAEARRVEAARIAAEEEEKRRIEQKLAEEAEIKRKAEEEALLRKKQEEDRLAQLRREEEEEERRRQQYLENERRRRESLPIVLSRCAAMIDDNDATAQSPTWLAKFLPLFTVKTRQLESSAIDSAPEDLWVANFQVASLLATKDLNLRTYTSFDRKSCTAHERQCLWRVARNMLSFEYEANGINTSVKQAAQRENENRPKFLVMEELFWVKVHHHAHLVGFNLRTQPISLASYASLASQTAPLPGINGTLAMDTKLVNGNHSHSPLRTHGVEHTDT